MNFIFYHKNSKKHEKEKEKLLFTVPVKKKDWLTYKYLFAKTNQDSLNSCTRKNCWNTFYNFALALLYCFSQDIRFSHIRHALGRMMKTYLHRPMKILFLPRDISKMFYITSKYFNIFNNVPPESWVAHITRDFLTLFLFVL